MRRVLLLAFIWGWSFLFIKVGLRAMTPGTVAFGRIAIGFVVITFVMRRRGLSLPRDAVMWRHFVVMGLCYGAVPFTLLAWGQQHIDSALASVMNAGTPMFAAIAAAIGLHERLRLPQVTGLALGFVGVAVAAGVGGDSLGSSSLVGAGAALGAAACYGFGYAYTQRYVVGVASLVAVGGQLAAATVLTAPQAVVGIATRGVDLEWRSLLSLLLLGVFASGLAYVLNYEAITEVGPTRASTVTYVIPVVAITLGVVFLDEPFRLSLLVGAALVALGIALLQDRLRNLRRVPAASVLLVVAMLFVGCRDDDGMAPAGGRACAGVVEEPLDPGSTHHLFAGGPETVYVTDPPTSGPHRTGGLPTGAVDEPLPRPVQVGVLEEGRVLVQYRDPADRAAVVGLAGEQVVVAPNPTLPARVVATAWRHKMTCTDVDTDALRRFADQRAGHGPGDEH
ncbi:MAG TPA: EamA family transporter [Acidimicrobiales bacterium]|nr:EamA family transporter [Acidimicrobiales bacterium]